MINNLSEFILFCLFMILILMIFWGIDTPWGNINIDFFPPALKIK